MKAPSSKEPVIDETILQNALNAIAVEAAEDVNEKEFLSSEEISSCEACTCNEEIFFNERPYNEETPYNEEMPCDEEAYFPSLEEVLEPHTELSMYESNLVLEIQKLYAGE